MTLHFAQTPFLRPLAIAVMLSGVAGAPAAADPLKDAKSVVADYYAALHGEDWTRLEGLFDPKAKIRGRISYGGLWPADTYVFLAEDFEKEITAAIGNDSGDLFYEERGHNVAFTKVNLTEDGVVVQTLVTAQYEADGLEGTLTERESFLVSTEENPVRIVALTTLIDYD